MPQRETCCGNNNLYLVGVGRLRNILRWIETRTHLREHLYEFASEISLVLIKTRQTQLNHLHQSASGVLKCLVLLLGVELQVALGLLHPSANQCLQLLIGAVLITQLLQDIHAKHLVKGIACSCILHGTACCQHTLLQHNVGGSIDIGLVKKPGKRAIAIFSQHSHHSVSDVGTVAVLFLLVGLIFLNE